MDACLFGTPEGTRTPNPQNRNLMLYPLSHRRVCLCIIADDDGKVKPDFLFSRKNISADQRTSSSRFAASAVSSGVLKQENRNQPSPQAPKPTPGVPTTPAFSIR